ncbi:glycosyltransferase [Candidatus Peregrinibacteria bacterium]|nr:glycosyltransferase [Candidatus Peregrinibacteria bacterium]
MPAILAFGFHDRKSPRHRSVCEELANDGGTVLECHTDVRGFFNKCRDLRKKFRALAPNADTVLVPFPGHFLMPIAWAMTRRPRKKLIFDAFVSLYDTDVGDRRRFSRWRPRAWTLWAADWLSMHLADEVLIDTEAHRRFLIEKFHLNPARVRAVYLQARNDLFYPIRNHKSEIRDRFEVFFYGTVIPLQGIEYILDAARILEERSAPVHFSMVGSEKLKRMVEESGRKNIAAGAFVPMEKLPDMIRSADLCLGIFGTSGKARRVIPHKVVDAIACGVHVLTADTPAIRERYANCPLVHLTRPGDAGEIAAAILRILKRP